MNDITTGAEASTSLTPPTTTADSQWKGLTLDELRMRRAIALVRREVERERLDSAVAQLRERVNDNGVRGLFFSDGTIRRLRVADYALLGWRLAHAIIKRRRRR